MYCEHPTCSLEASTICKYHCHLSVCEQHRIEHEKKLLIEFENQLDDLSNPISSLLNQSRYDLKQSEESRQCQLNRINSLFDRQSSSIDQRLKFSNKTNELISTKRQQLIKYKNGDNQLTKEDYQQIETLSNQVQTNLQEQRQLTTQICDHNSNIDLWPIQKENNVSKEIECIELSDSEDELSQNSTDNVNMDQSNEMNDTSSSSSSDNNTETSSIEFGASRESNLVYVRDFCPLTHYGVYGLNQSHNLLCLCSKSSNQRRYLYAHFTRTHRIKSPIAYQLVKAIRNGSDPIKTKIFPQDNTAVIIENIQCPFDNSSLKFNRNNSIPNTPCHSTLAYHGFKIHLRTVHSITKLNAELIYNAMKNYGTISQVQFEEDLCEIE